jgi:type II secretory pathway component GspD/PulD (secretin)
VEPSSFAQALAGKHGDNSTNSPSPQFYKWVRDLFASMGVDFAPPRAVFFNDRSGQLMVRATLEELDLIENALAVLSTPPPMVKIEARFVKVRQGQARALGFTWYSGTNVIARSTNGAAIDGTLAEQKPQSSFLGILTDPQFRVTLQALEKRDGTDIVVAPPVTTLSRRAARIEINSSTNIVMQGQSQTIQVGPSADVLAEVSEDGFSIELNVGAAVVELLGYDDSSTLPLPRLRVRKLVTTTARVWDGQTLVLTNPVDVNGNPAEGPGEKLLLYVKATILDPSGNPIHTDADMPFRTNSIPPQPSQGTR